MADSSMSIGLSGILAAQTALNVAGENITNSTTPGYARRQVQLSETAPTGPDANTETGVNADTIVRDRDMYLEGQVQSYNAGLSSATTLSQYLNQIQSLLQEPSSTSNGISTQLDTFFNDWQSLAADPSDSTTRSTLLDAAQQLAQSLQDLQSGLVSVQNSVDQDLSVLGHPGESTDLRTGAEQPAHRERHEQRERTAVAGGPARRADGRSWPSSPAPSIRARSSPPPRCRSAARRSCRVPPAPR